MQLARFVLLLLSYISPSKSVNSPHTTPHARGDWQQKCTTPHGRETKWVQAARMGCPTAVAIQSGSARSRSAVFHRWSDRALMAIHRRNEPGLRLSQTGDRLVAPAFVKQNYWFVQLKRNITLQVHNQKPCQLKFLIATLRLRTVRKEWRHSIWWLQMILQMK